ncbi:hypothetical protein ACFW2T_32885 [Streptomyces sp. NPDC058892]|uniref:hypothetical protein n=1 Tax=unclassified Streptomyces TaxID=2593676 RepID=UPI00367E8A35
MADRRSWGLRLFLVRTPTGMPALEALANPKLYEREVLSAMVDREPHPATDRPRLLVIVNKGFASKEFEAEMAFRGAELRRPFFKREPKRTGDSLLRSGRQLIESVNDTLKGQLTWNSTVADPRRRRRPRRPVHPRDGRRDLARPQDRPARHPILDCLRPLITLEWLVQAAAVRTGRQLLCTEETARASDRVRLLKEPVTLASAVSAELSGTL